MSNYTHDEITKIIMNWDAQKDGPMPSCLSEAYYGKPQCLNKSQYAFSKHGPIYGSYLPTYQSSNYCPRNNLESNDWRPIDTSGMKTVYKN